MSYVAYYRVSTKRQGESGLGLEAQQHIVNYYYRDPLAEFVEIESGKTASNRPELEEAIRLCLDGGHTLVVAKVDRLSRNTEDTLGIYERLNGRLLSCDLPSNEDDPATFKFMLTLQAALAERERELISVRTKAALAAAKRRGVELGTTAAENFTNETRGIGPIVNRATAREAYRQANGYIGELRRQGLSYDHIAKRLNDEGWSTRTGRPFQAMTVWRITQRNGD